MSQPFDLDAVVVESDDAEPFRFTWGGRRFEMPAFLALPADRQIAVIDQITAETVDAPKLLSVLQQIVGDDLIAELSATKGGPSNKPLTTMRLMPLVMAWVNDQGAGLGKSPDSSGSSASTAPRSKQTSRSGRGRKTS